LLGKNKIYSSEILPAKPKNEEEMNTYNQSSITIGFANVINNSLIGLSTGCGDNHSTEIYWDK
jgi:hypothetical protein